MQVNSMREFIRSTFFPRPFLRGKDQGGVTANSPIDVLQLNGHVPAGHCLHVRPFRFNVEYGMGH